MHALKCTLYTFILLLNSDVLDFWVQTSMLIPLQWRSHQNLKSTRREKELHGMKDQFDMNGIPYIAQSKSYFEIKNLLNPFLLHGF